MKINLINNNDSRMVEYNDDGFMTLSFHVHSLERLANHARKHDETHMTLRGYLSDSSLNTWEDVEIALDYTDKGMFFSMMSYENRPIVGDEFHDTERIAMGYVRRKLTRRERRMFASNPSRLIYKMVKKNFDDLLCQHGQGLDWLDRHDSLTTEQIYDFQCKSYGEEISITKEQAESILANYCKKWNVEMDCSFDETTAGPNKIAYDNFYLRAGQYEFLGYREFNPENPDNEAAITWWEFDYTNPDRVFSRHCGAGQGCFWTDWEDNFGYTPEEYYEEDETV